MRMSLTLRYVSLTLRYELDLRIAPRGERKKNFSKKRHLGKYKDNSLSLISRHKQASVHWLTLAHHYVEHA